MTPDQLENLRYMQSSVEASGFGTFYSDKIEQGIRAGLPEIPLTEAWKPYNKGTELMLWKPVIVENDENPGRYMYLGFQATLKVDDKDLPADQKIPPVTQLISNYRQAGPSTDQSYLLLKGKTVQHREYDNKLKDYRLVYTRLDLNTRVSAGENHPIIRANADSVNLGILYSKVDFDATQTQKEKHLKALQEGKDVPARIKEPIPGSSDERSVDVYLRLYLKDDGRNKTMAMKVLDTNGVELQEKEVPVKRNDIVQTKGMNTTMDEGAMSADVLRMLTEAKEATPTIGMSPRRSA